MSLEVEKRTISEIFTKVGSLNIPRNQREFTWDEKQWRDMFSDIQNSIILNDQGHYEKLNNVNFIGSVIFQKPDDSSKKLYIIDGQQRLTSTLILLACLRKLLFEYGETGLARGVENYLLFTNSDGESEVRIKNDDYQQLRYIVYTHCIEIKRQGTIEECLTWDKISFDSKDSFVSCYNFFRDTIMSNLEKSIGTQYTEYLKAVRDVLLEFTLSEITVNNEVDAYEVFEVLNARGKSLEQHELLKNFIFRYYKETPGIDCSRDRWNALYNKMFKNKISFSVFMSHYATFKCGKIDNQETYYSIKNKYPKRNVEDLLVELEKCGEIYLLISGKESEIEVPKQIEHDLKILSKVSKAQIKPILLAIFMCNEHRETFGSDELKNIIRNLKSFMAKYISVLKMKTNTLEQLIYSNSEIIYSDDVIQSRKNIQEFWKSLIAKMDNINSFQDQFKMIGYSKHNKQIPDMILNRTVCNTIIDEYEQYLSGDFDKQVPFTIEHILDDSSGEIAAKIGNLIPLTKKDNGSCNGLDFEEKKLIYASSKFATASAFVDKYGTSEWNEESIETRNTEMAILFDDEIWKLPKKIMK